jgi:cell division protein ZapA
MAEKKNRVLMKINGQEYPIAGMESKEYLIRVGTYVDEQMEEISRLNRQLSLSMVSVLTAVNIADQYLKLQDSYKELLNQAPPDDDQVARLKKELEQKTQSLQQEKDYSRNLQKRLNAFKQEKEALNQNYHLVVKESSEKQENYSKAQRIIKELQDQLYESQMKVAEIHKERQ